MLSFGFEGSLSTFSTLQLQLRNIERYGVTYEIESVEITEQIDLKFNL
jgi:fluoride ion exporter CrcB/FEX